MPTVQAPVQLTMDHLLAAAKQLSSAELHTFMQQLVTWQQQNGQPADEEAALLVCIKENSRLPIAAQRRFDRLRRKRQAATLTKAETAELQALWQQVEHMNVVRLEALATLAQRRGTDVRTCMRELGLAENPDVF
jgi:hypothetical protein